MAGDVVDRQASCLPGGLPTVRCRPIVGRLLHRFGEAHGQWVGARLGFAGQVDAEDLRAVLAGPAPSDDPRVQGAVIEAGETAMRFGDRLVGREAIRVRREPSSWRRTETCTETDTPRTSTNVREPLWRRWTGLELLSRGYGTYWLVLLDPQTTRTEHLFGRNWVLTGVARFCSVLDFL